MKQKECSALASQSPNGAGLESERKPDLELVGDQDFMPHEKEYLGEQGRAPGKI